MIEKSMPIVKKYHTLEYKFTNEPIKLKNIELQVDFEKYYDEKTHTTNFIKMFLYLNLIKNIEQMKILKKQKMIV